MTWEDFPALSFYVRVGVAAFCGAVLGLERQLRGKPAGIRTSILICLGTMTFVHLGIEMQGTAGDPTRVLGQVVTGVGFLGAGVILTSGGLVKGVTSAAVIWVLASVGAAIGAGHYGVALSVTLVSVGLLVGIERLERGVRALRRGVHADGASNDAGTE